jgi:hypothetical protein
VFLIRNKICRGVPPVSLSLHAGPACQRAASTWRAMHHAGPTRPRARPCHKALTGRRSVSEADNTCPPPTVASPHAPARQPRSDALPPRRCVRASRHRHGPKSRATAAARARRRSEGKRRRTTTFPPRRRTTALTPFRRRVLQLLAASPLLCLPAQVAAEPRVSERCRCRPSTPSTPSRCCR